MQPLIPADPSRLRNQIGLILNHADTFHHFRNLLALLEPDQFEIVIAGDRAALEAIARSHGYAHVWYQDILHAGPRYRYTLSNYYIYYYDLHDETGQTVGKIYLPQLLGAQAIKMSYTMGVDYWSYADWNRIFAVQLCYGPWQAERLSPFGGRIFQVGYPRYDDFFNQPFDRAGWLARWNLPERPTIVWLPTRYQHTLRSFGEAVASLSQDYNVLLKPHPLTWEEDPGLIRWLQMLPFSRLIEQSVDTLNLYALADYVFCDYGGAPFGAIYTDRRLLLLNHYAETHFDPHQLHIQGPGPTRLADLNPTEVYLRQSIVAVDPGERHRLPEILADKQLWVQQQQARAALRAEFFAPEYGTASARVAEILRQLLSEVPQ